MDLPDATNDLCSGGMYFTFEKNRTQHAIRFLSRKALWMDASTSICQKGKVTPLHNRFFKKRHTNCLSYFALDKMGTKRQPLTTIFTSLCCKSI